MIGKRKIVNKEKFAEYVSKSYMDCKSLTDIFFDSMFGESGDFERLNELFVEMLAKNFERLPTGLEIDIPLSFRTIITL